MIENQKETPQEKPKSTPTVTVIVIVAHIAHPFPLDQRPPAVSGGMEHEEQKFFLMCLSGDIKTVARVAQAIDGIPPMGWLVFSF